jgi:hypothetical protein
LQGFEGGGSMRRYLAGAALMGFGGMLAGGCAVGAGVTGASIFALTAWVTLFAIWIAAAVTDWVVDRKLAGPIVPPQTLAASPDTRGSELPALDHAEPVGKAVGEVEILLDQDDRHLALIAQLAITRPICWMMLGWMPSVGSSSSKQFRPGDQRARDGTAAAAARPTGRRRAGPRMSLSTGNSSKMSSGMVTLGARQAGEARSPGSRAPSAAGRSSRPCGT